MAGIRSGASSANQATTSAKALTAIVGARVWQARLTAILHGGNAGKRSNTALRQRHAIELTVERLRQGAACVSAAERAIAHLCADAVRLYRGLDETGRARFAQRLLTSLGGDATLIEIFHLFSTARVQAGRGFEVTHAWALDDAAPFDLLLTRESCVCEVACDVVSAEDGRGVHRGAWFELADRIDPDLSTWLAAHPGRYLLKVTLPQGLTKPPGEGCATLADVQARIRAMLSERRRSDEDAALVLRLDPLLLAAAQADDNRLVSRLRQEFGPEAHLSVTVAPGGVFVMAARAGREDAIAVAIRRRLAAIAPARLSGTRPGILSVFVEDTNPTEWTGLRERLELEGEARQFLTLPEARAVVCVAFSSRQELFGLPGGCGEPDLRFRNPAHPSAKVPALASAVCSSM